MLPPDNGGLTLPHYIGVGAEPRAKRPRVHGTGPEPLPLGDGTSKQSWLQRFSDALEVEALFPRVASAREVARQADQQHQQQRSNFYRQPCPDPFYQPHPPQRAATVRQAQAVTFRVGAPSPSAVCAQARVVSSVPTLPLAVEAKQTRQEEEEEEAADADAAGERARRAEAAAVVEWQYRQSQEAESAAAAARFDVFPNERRGAQHRGELGIPHNRPSRCMADAAAKRAPGAEPHRMLSAFEVAARRHEITHCEHGRQKYQCQDCRGGAFCNAFCKHGRRKYQCQECGGKGICEHGRLRYSCKECGGKGICEHGHRKQTCKECGGSGICKHSRERRYCKECKVV